jgi:hypothetical protein
MIIVIVCLRLTQQDDIDRFYISVRGMNSSRTVPNGWRITRQLSSNVEVPMVYLPASNMGDPKGTEGVGVKPEFAKLTSTSAAQEKCSSSVSQWTKVQGTGELQV